MYGAGKIERKKANKTNKIDFKETEGGRERTKKGKESV